MSRLPAPLATAFRMRALDAEAKVALLIATYPLRRLAFEYPPKPAGLPAAIRMGAERERRAA